MIQASCSLAAVGGMCSKIKPGLLKLRHASPAVRPCRKPGARQRPAIRAVATGHNATGNFTKIVQRISIKIAVDPDDPLAGQLRPGMSVAPTIDTKPPRDTVLSTLVRSKTGDHGLALNR